VLEFLSRHAPNRGLRDLEVNALLVEARSQIAQYANPAWLTHSPQLVVGMEESLRTIATLQEQHTQSQTAALLPVRPSTVAAHPPVPPAPPAPPIHELNRRPEGSVGPSGSIQRDLRRPVHQVSASPVTTAPERRPPLNSPQPSHSRSPLTPTPQLPPQTSSAASAPRDITPDVTTKDKTCSLAQAAAVRST
jgi:hypothetical protein